MGSESKKNASSQKNICDFTYTSQCLYLILNNQETSHFYWHQFWDKNDVKSGAIEIIFKSHEPFQSYLLTGQANSAKKAG